MLVRDTLLRDELVELLDPVVDDMVDNEARGGWFMVEWLRECTYN